MKNNREYFNYLYSLERTGMKYNLENITVLLENLGNPHNNFQSIHIAGTNGKGATASFISSILTEHGLKTGLFTSPHIIKFNERIRVNGKCIHDKFIVDFLKRNNIIIRKIKPSFFEVNTAMAFEYFSRMKVDIAVVECGLGGRLDSTNILYPELSIITQIGMDHMQYLGNTLKKIALEKIGIVKPGIDVIVSDTNKSLKHLFKKNIDKEFLHDLDNVLTASRIKQHNYNTSFTYKKNKCENNNYSIPLLGDYQTRNAAAAMYACEKYLKDIGIQPERKNIQKGLLNVITNSGYRCRLERVKINNKEIFFDISHNADGLKQTRKALKNLKPDIVVFGIMEDKNINDSIKEVSKLSRNIIITKADYKRAAEPSYLLDKFKIMRLNTQNISITNSVKEAVKHAVYGKNNSRILITGSFFIVGEAIKVLKLQYFFK